jgi:Holliday junction resolvasome RuvABC ATP-dependent DNA helicase subunit
MSNDSENKNKDERKKEEDSKKQRNKQDHNRKFEKNEDEFRNGLKNLAKRDNVSQYIKHKKQKIIDEEKDEIEKEFERNQDNRRNRRTRRKPTRWDIDEQDYRNSRKNDEKFREQERKFKNRTKRKSKDELDMELEENRRKREKRKENEKQSNIHFVEITLDELFNNKKNRQHFEKEIFEQMELFINNNENHQQEEVNKEENIYEQYWKNRGHYDEIINFNLKTLDDLIKLGKDKRYFNEKRYNINMKAVQKLVEPLTELNNMIGMADVKKNIFEQIIYYLQDFDKCNQDLMHTIIQGNPGCGKTELGKILAKIYLAMGIVQNDKFRIVRRSDLVGRYLGETAIKTQKVIDDIRGGVLFIDEAYSLGNPEQRDSFSKECLDTINQNLTENKTNFVCIIAGYQESLKSSFFSYNPGLERRFTMVYKVDNYNAEDLMKIYIKKVYDAQWKFEEDAPKLSLFEENREYFRFNGGDMESIFQLTKIIHSQRVLNLEYECKKKISNFDIEESIKRFKNGKEENDLGNINLNPFMYS